MKTNKSKKEKFIGFSLIELMVVIVVIGILATVANVSYTGIQAKARDASLLSDIDALDSIEASYATKNHVSGKAWYSGDGIDTELNFTPSEGNVVRVDIDNSDYCIRAYNPNATKNSIDNAYTRESSSGGCNKVLTQPIAASMVAITSRNSCVIASNDQAYCWGRYTEGQLGDGRSGNWWEDLKENHAVAVKTSGALSGKTIRTIDGGAWHVCAIASDNKAYCWGYDYHGEIGNGLSIQYSYPEPAAVNTSGVLNGKTIKSIKTGSIHTCAIASDDKAYCWGNNTLGQLGNGIFVDSNVPVTVNTSGVLNGKTIKYIEAGGGHTCAIASDDKAYCWGDNLSGQLGNGTIISSGVPVPVSTGGQLTGKTIKSISVGGFHTCAIASDDKAYCWGRNDFGQLGDGLIINSPIPVPVNTGGVLSGKIIKSISAGNQHTCVVASDNKAYCWGFGQYGTLGNNVSYNIYPWGSLTPVAVYTDGVMNGKILSNIAASDYHTCAFTYDNQMYCWGYNYEYQMGSGLTLPPTQYNVPIKINNSIIL